MAIFARGTLALLHNRPRTVTEYEYRGRAQQREESGMSNMTNETNPACHAPQQEAQPAACYELLADAEGYIVENDAEKIGTASVLLGAGREKKGDPIDYAAGIILHKKRGDYVRRGESLATFCGQASRFAAAEACYRSGLRIGPDRPAELPLIYAIVTRDGVQRL